jgi:hypothetical protein
MQGTDFASEEKFPLARLRSLHPAVRNVSLRTLHRWATRGARGHKLESQKVGWAIMSSPAAIDRFLAAINCPTSDAPAPRSPAQRKAASARSDRVLNAAGA